jgi:AraC-like DNA-binding protein
MFARTTSSAWMRGVANTFASVGLDAPALFADAQLPFGKLDDMDYRWPTEKVNRLWTLAVERSGNPAIALANCRTARPDQYGVVSYVMLSSPDLQTGLERLVRFLCLVSDAASIVIEKVEGGGGRWVKLDLFGGDSAVPRQRQEYGLLTLLTFCRWMVGRELAPQMTSFIYPAPARLDPYTEAFGSPFQWSAPFNGFLLSEADLASRLPTAIPELASVHDQIASMALLKLERPEATHRSIEAIARRLQDGTPLRAAIAADLGFSDHTFQRRLAEEGVSFSELVDETRRELAQKHLGDPRLSFGEIAYLLGYSDQSTFYRACLRWFGASPGDYRSRLRSG